MRNLTVHLKEFSKVITNTVQQTVNKTQVTKVIKTPVAKPVNTLCFKNVTRPQAEIILSQVYLEDNIKLARYGHEIIRDNRTEEEKKNSSTKKAKANGKG